MRVSSGLWCSSGIGAWFLALTIAWPATFSVATYNVEGYLEIPTRTRASKSEESKVKVRESIRALKPDVLALQEIGGTNALLELRDALAREGLEFPHWELVNGSDTNINVALLSRFPFTARRPHTHESFLLGGRRFRVSRGIAEVDVQVTSHYSFTLIAAHLKSRRVIPQADEAELRLEEAKILREKIDQRLAADASANLIVLGDFNDSKDSASTKTIVGQGRTRLVDTRPAERNGGAGLTSELTRDSRQVTWTHYWVKDDTYSRIDFILVSPGMANEWVRQQTYVLAMPDWGLASDHRPILATFIAEDQ